MFEPPDGEILHVCGCEFSEVFSGGKVTVQDVQNNRPQTRALHALSLHSQLLSEANGRSAHSEIKIHPIANKFA